MWTLDTPVFELVLRAVAVFSFLFIVCRIWGKKHLGQMAPFDLILLLIMSEAVQNSLIGEDKSVPAGFITVASMIGLNIILNKISHRSKKMESFIQGRPKVLIRDGKVDELMMKRETITDQEIHEAIRKQGVEHIEDVGLATIETDGEISVIKREDLHSIH